ncbi:MAG: ROK family protein [Planctomycetes bacterium]|nr:ROK family protein [Planctomycetota bacterium]
MSANDRIMGVDVGGTGVKAAIVDVRNGTLASEWAKLDTPQPSTPDAVTGVIQQLMKQLKWNGPIGVGFPGLVKGGSVRRAPNLDPSWIGVDLVNTFQKELGVPLVAAGNDADAAGMAEIRFGAGKGIKGNVMMVTLGTGIGTAVFLNGQLVPDTELGHIELRGKDAERSAANSAKERKGWSWKKWGKNVNRYLSTLEFLMGVDLFIIGGGVSKKADKFFPHLKDVTCKVVPATMGNQAGVVGAALFALDALDGAKKKR